MRPGIFMPKFARKGNRMRQFIVASHAHFASGIVESIGLLSGERENVHPLSMYVDGNEDLVKEAAAILDGFAADDEVVVCTDLFGGSVNNEFTTHLVTNMTLPLLIQLLFVPDSTPIDEAIRQIVEADDTKVKYVNDLLGQAELDEF